MLVLFLLSLCSTLQPIWELMKVFLKTGYEKKEENQVEVYSDHAAWSREGY